MFVDKVVVKLKAGNGGDGITSFYRDKFISLGGPDGGDGGNGGNIIFVSDDSKNTLIDFYYTKKYYANDGEKGSNKNCHGKSASDLVVKVPVGTIVSDPVSGKIVADFNEAGQSICILTGGKGGRGNAKFATSTRQAPGFSELGEKTDEFEVVLEMKIIADVGLIGFPNTGKSTLLSVVSSAKPKIANYHFTTLAPNLGVVKHYDKSFVVADIPGLIEGASDGVGLGHDFLKHIERTRMMINVIDAAGLDGRDPVADFDIINQEVIKYSPRLKDLPQVIALNKIDICENLDELIERFKNHDSTKNVEIFPISALSNKGVKVMLDKVAAVLEKLPKTEPLKVEIRQLDLKKEKTFEVTKLNKNTFKVVGGYVDNLIRGVVLSDTESFAYFQKRLRDDGIIAALKEKGAVDGSVIQISDAEFEMRD